MRNVSVLSLLFALFVISSCRFAADVPLAIWSGEGYFTGKNIPVTNTLLPSDVEGLLDAVITPLGIHTGFLTKFVTPKASPEVVVIFAERKIRSDQISTYKKSFANLKNLVQNEKSSLFAPYVDLEVSFDSSIVNLAYTTKTRSGQVFYVGKGSFLLHDLKKRVDTTTILNLENLEATLTDSPIFSNGIADLIVVHLDSHTTDMDAKFKESDMIISSLHKTISSLTKSYVMTYMGLECDEPQWTTKFATPVSEAYTNKRFILAANNSNNTSNSTIPIFRQFFGGWFWELFLVCFFLIPLLITGVYAIDGIQTPLFDGKIKKK